MIPDNILLFIIMLLMSWIFGDKLLPNIAVAALALITMMNIVTGTVTPTEVFQTFLIMINVVYSVYNILVPESERMEQI